MVITIKYQPYGNRAVLLEWLGGTPQKRLQEIRLFSEKITTTKLEEIVEYNFVYDSMLIVFNDKVISTNNFIEKLKILNTYPDSTLNINRNHFKIPICYDATFGKDLEIVAKNNNLSVDEVINLHSNVTYTIYGIGFLPGFLYLGGLSEKIYCNRKATPRLRVPKGAVAIGGKQTGIYPEDSPGGWQIIGKTPISLFDVFENPPSKFKAGDTIEFQPISLTEFEILEEKIKNKTNKQC
jgi:inhibitor of KinA